MSRKKNNKEKTLSWAKFIRKFCSRCDKCITNINARFCYRTYLMCPENWKKNVFPKLVKSNLFLDSFNGFVGWNFEDVFCTGCKSGDYILHGTCNEIADCIAEFSEQLRNSKSGTPASVAKNKQKEYPKPVFFTNNPEKWNVIIKKVLLDNKEQSEEKQ